MKSMLNFRTPVMSLAQLDGSAVKEEIQLFRTGTFHHPEYGQFDITPDLLKKMAENFKLNVRGIDVALDYKHASEDIAAAWFKELFLSQDGKELWAKVQWTPKGQAVVAEKEFRYISPEFTFDYQDNETLKTYGPTLLGAGLTNRPTIKKMDPVVELSDGPAPCKVLSQEKGKVTPPSIPTPKPKEIKAMDYKAMDASQVDALSPEECKALAKDLLAQWQKAQGDQVVAADKLAKADAAAKMAEKKVSFAKMLTEGKVCKAQETAFLDGDMVKFSELAAPLNTAPTGKTGEPLVTDKEPETAEAAQAVVSEKAKVMLSEKKAGSLGEAISKVLREHPTLNAKIYG